MSRGLYFNFQIGGLGIPRTANRNVTIRQQIEQLLFTIKGERLNRPDFGCGVQQMIFGGAGPELASAAEYLIGAAIRDHLGDRILVDGVRVTAKDATLAIDIVFTLRETGEQSAEGFVRPLEGTP